MFWRYAANAFRKLSAIILSAMMALGTTPLWAGESQPAMGRGDTTEGVPVLFQAIPQPNGSIAYFVAAPVAAADEVQSVTELARQASPQTFTLSIAGPQDPALKAAAKTGRLKDIDPYALSDKKSVPILQSERLTPPLRKKIPAKIGTINKFCRHKKAGLITA